MKARVYWEYPNFATHLGEQNYEDIELPDNYTEEEIEQEVKEVALEHFGWSYEMLTKEKK